MKKNPLLPKEIDPAMYQWWKRFAAESSLLYTVENMSHFCWTNPSEIRSDMVNPDGRRLYGCLRCGRSHMCSPPECLTCPRLPSPSNPNMFVCPFSGHELCLISVGSQNSSFDNHELTLAAMREVFAAKAAINNEKRLGKRIGVKMARRLERGANQSASSTTRNKMRSQAAEARASAFAMQKVRRFERLTRAYRPHHLAPNWKRDLMILSPSLDKGGGDEELEKQRQRLVQDMALSSGGTFYNDDDCDNNNNNDDDNVDDMELEKQRHRLVKDITLGNDNFSDDDGDNNYYNDHDYDNNDDNDDDRDTTNASSNGVLDPLWYSPAVVIPRIEMEADNAYYQEYLAPIAAFIKSRPDLINIFKPPPHPPPLQQQPHAKPREKKTWRLLPLLGRLKVPANEREEIAPHQLETLHYMKLFVNHFTPLLLKESRVVSACDPFIYAQLCDRFLWLFHMHVAPIHNSPTPSHKKNGGAGGSGSIFDPNGPSLPRLLFTLLTLIFTQPGYARDSVTDAKLVVWFPDPWLQACSNAGLFNNQHDVPQSLLPQSQKSGGIVNLTNIYEGLMSILKIPSLSPQTLYTFFRAVFSSS